MLYYNIWLNKPGSTMSSISAMPSHMYFCILSPSTSVIQEGTWSLKKILSATRRQTLRLVLLQIAYEKKIRSVLLTSCSHSQTDTARGSTLRLLVHRAPLDCPSRMSSLGARTGPRPGFELSASNIERAQSCTNQGWRS